MVYAFHDKNGLNFDSSQTCLLILKVNVMQVSTYLSGSNRLSSNHSAWFTNHGMLSQIKSRSIVVLHTIAKS